MLKRLSRYLLVLAPLSPLACVPATSTDAALSSFDAEAEDSGRRDDAADALASLDGPRDVATHLSDGSETASPADDSAGIGPADGGDGTSAADGRSIDASERDASDRFPDAEAGTDAGSFGAVQAIFNASCVTCHDGSRTGLPTYGALPLTAGAAYDALVNRPAHETCGGILVIPGDPDRSYLVQKVSTPAPCEGQHMPRAFEVLPAASLSPEQLASIRTWIELGARR